MDTKQTPNESQPLAGRVAVVTGGAGGIGRATALELSTMGAIVVVADLDDEGGAQTVQTLEGDGHTAIYRRADVAVPEQVALLVAHTVDAFGRLDIMFNNAGIASGGPMLDWTPEQYDRELQSIRTASSTECNRPHA